MQKLIYADHSATTPTKPEVLEAMIPYFSNKYGNASSIYSIGRISRGAVEDTRKKVAHAINCDDNEIYFTAGGSESDNMIIRGIAKANLDKGRHIITSKIEHLAVLNTCKKLEEEGFEVTYLNVDKDGIVDMNELKQSIREDTVLISIMFANNEVGTIQPIEEIGNIAKENNIFFHTDAVQAIGNVHIDVKKLNIDALSLSAHKFYGPKGVGAAYIKSGIQFENLINGGHQESSKRAGTENIAGIVGIGKAIEISTGNIDRYNEKLYNLRESLLRKIQANIPNVKLNGHRIKRLPGNLNVSFDSINGQTLLVMLDMNGICVSNGSACNSSSVTPSHVLTAIGLDENTANSSIRVTFGESNTPEDVEYIFDSLYKLTSKIRFT
jgi:cysteine desulfurase